MKPIVTACSTYSIRSVQCTKLRTCAPRTFISSSSATITRPSPSTSLRFSTSAKLLQQPLATQQRLLRQRVVSHIPTSTSRARSPASQLHFSTSKGDTNDTNDDHPHKLFEEQLADMQSEREALFGFTDNDVQAWGQPNSNTSQLDSNRMEQINTARSMQQQQQQRQQDVEVEENTAIEHILTNEKQTTETVDMPFTHVSSDGSSVHMVDVGHKTVTQRMAKAQSKVIFPPEVMDAFFATKDGNELTGPKGPIFSTAKLAGIMAAKKTSDLIPLCHPLPLDQVQVDISLRENIVTITCECRVTHKTGVEMEALTGASVAALTIYDMVKAVSHQVQIGETRLLEKTGGKRLVKEAAGPH